jgi:hypothetical protein
LCCRFTRCSAARRAGTVSLQPAMRREKREPGRNLAAYREKAALG